MNDLKPALAQLAKDCGARKLVLFGSRARGDNRPRSDIELAVFGMPEEQQTRFWCGMDDLPTLLKYDVVFVDDYTSPELLAESNPIERIISSGDAIASASSFDV